MLPLRIEDGMTRRQWLKTSSAAVALAMTGRAGAETGVASYETFIPELMENKKVEGLSMAAVVDGEVEWSRAFGMRNTAEGA